MRSITPTALIALFFACGCAPLTNPNSNLANVTPSPTPTTCTLTDNNVQNNNTDSIASGEKVGEIFEFTGATGSTVSITSITLTMSSPTLTNASLEIYTYTASTNPDAGTPLGTSTLTTGFGSGSATSSLVFPFNPNVTLTIATEYAMVLSTTGGAFQLSTSNAANGPLDFFTNGAWATGTVNEALSMAISYASVCSN